MFCPKCKAEYREGFTVCADCNIPLVKEKPPEEPKPEYVDLEEILSTSNMGEIVVIKSILNGENIPYLAQGEYFAAVRAPIPVRILVPKEFCEKARELLKLFL